MRSSRPTRSGPCGTRDAAIELARKVLPLSRVALEPCIGSELCPELQAFDVFFSDHLKIPSQLNGDPFQTDPGEVIESPTRTVFRAFVAEPQVPGIQAPQNPAVLSPFLLVRPPMTIYRLATFASDFFGKAPVSCCQFFLQSLRVSARPANLANGAVETASPYEALVHRLRPQFLANPASSPAYGSVASPFYEHVFAIGADLPTEHDVQSNNTLRTGNWSHPRWPLRRGCRLEHSSARSVQNPALSLPNPVLRHLTRSPTNGSGEMWHLRLS